jgi:hypothetical protein
LTQYGDGLVRPNFRNRLRSHIGETEMSLIYGELDADAAGLLITKVVPPKPLARHTTAGRLRQEGFIVRHSPTSTNARHVSVYPPWLDDGYGDWDDDLATSFDACFTEDSDQGGGDQR